MSWTAIVPLKAAIDRKTRLAGVLSPDERVALSEAMLARVAAAIAACPAIGHAVLLGPEAAPGWRGEWRRDEGRGLNIELDAAAAAIGGDILVLHADLPLVRADDIAAMTAGDALAPDRAGTGTNAVAVRGGRRFSALFGAGSFRQFRARWPDAAEVRRAGLALDVDTADDLAWAEADGFRWR